MKHEKLRCFKAKKKVFFFSKNMKSYTKDSSKSYAKTKQIKKNLQDTYVWWHLENQGSLG